MKNGKFLFFFILSILPYTICFPQGMPLEKWSEKYRISALGIDEGLPYSFVEDVIKDSQGFLWTATKGGGVCRYDSYNFIIFNREDSIHPIRNNFAKALCEDGFKRLWIAGESGLECIDILTLQPLDIPCNLTQWSILQHEEYSDLHHDRNGRLWLSSTRGLFCLTFDTKGRITKIHKGTEIKTDGHEAALHEDGDKLWIGVSNRIYTINTAPPHTVAPYPEIHLPQNADIKIVYRKENDLWIGTTHGLFRHNLTQNTLKAYHATSTAHSLTQDYITDIAETTEHRLLISTLRGINVYREQTDDFEQVYSENQPTDTPDFRFCDFINCILVDRQIIWIGTEADGLMQFSPKRLFINNYIHKPECPESLSPHAVNAICEDEDGFVYIGTIEGGLNRFHPKEERFTHFTTKDGLSHNAVSCFARSGQSLWVGTWGGGVCLIEHPQSDNPVIRHLLFDGNPDATTGYVCALHFDSLHQQLWIVTDRDIYIYQPDSQKLTIPFKHNKPGGMQNGNAGSYTDIYGNLWLGLTSGLCRIKPACVGNGEENFQLWPYKPDCPDSREKIQVTFISATTDHRLLIGTNGQGFYIGTPSDHGNHIFKNYTTRDGLTDNFVRGIIEDNMGKIWISTLHGLSCFDLKEKRFQNFTKPDGLVCNEFYWNAAYKSLNGVLYFGSLNGLSAVDPSTPSIHRPHIPLVFTQCRTLHGELPVNHRSIDMHERNKFVSIEFAALDYTPTPQAAYSYRLTGINDQWTVVSPNNRTLSYANLPPGRYTLEVCYSTDGIHFDHHTAERLVLNIEPYFYKTYWFYTLVVICILLAMYLLLKWRVHTLKQQKNTLHRKVLERTRELEKQKQLLLLRTSELEEQNAILNRQKTEIIAMSERIQELTADKLSFFTNITHEFRTPLTLIIGPIGRLLRSNIASEFRQQLQIINRNAQYLLSLVNQLLDFRKVESDCMNISPAPGMLLPFFRNIELLFNTYSSNKKPHIRYYYHLSEQIAIFDADALHKILLNLVSNAIKFTPHKGSIKLYASVWKRAHGLALFVCVSDTGPGIAEKDMAHIFDRFYQSSNQSYLSQTGQSGTGIGLYLCRNLVKLQGGEIWVKNNHTQGCSFRFFIPLEESISKTATGQFGYKKNEETTPETEECINRTPCTILIVEDNEDMREYLRSILNPYYRCLEATQGEEALNILQTQQTDFILSDLMMPVMDGMELSRRVKSDFRISHIPFLILTAKKSEYTHAQSFEFGADAFLTKPFDEHLLLSCIAGLLSNRRKMQERFAYHMVSDELHINPDTYDKDFMNKVLDTIKKNYTNANYGVDEFVTDMGMSRSLLYKKIQSLTGIPIGEMLRNYRLNIAKEILSGRSGMTLNISEVAYQVGFNDPKYFTRCFTKHFKMSPSKFIRK